MIALFNNETILTQSSDNAVILTTQRIYQEYSKKGKSYNESIMLENIISCKQKFSFQIIFLILATVSLLGGILGFFIREIHLLRTLIVTSIWIILYLITRFKYIIIKSISQAIKIKVNGMKKQQIAEFIGKINQAKIARLEILKIRSV